MNNLGVLEKDRSRFTHARRLYRDALDLSKKVGEPRLEAMVLDNLGILAHLQGAAAESRQLLADALRMERQIGDRWGQASVLSTLATTEMEDGQIAHARSHGQQALQIAEDIQHRRLVAGVLTTQAALERRAGTAVAEVQRRLGLAADALGNERKSPAAVLLCVELGHAALAAGQSGRAFLHRAAEAAEGMELGPQSQIGIRLASLNRAADTFDAGEHGLLFRGECIEDLPAGLRRWLDESGQLPGVGTARPQNAAGGPQVGGEPSGGTAPPAGIP